MNIQINNYYYVIYLINIRGKSLNSNNELIKLEKGGQKKTHPKVSVSGEFIGAIARCLP